MIRSTSYGGKLHPGDIVVPESYVCGNEERQVNDCTARLDVQSCIMLELSRLFGVLDYKLETTDIPGQLILTEVTIYDRKRLLNSCGGNK